MTLLVRTVAAIVGSAVLAAACGDGGDPRLAGDEAVGRTELAGTDLTRHEVPLDEIIFDTFDGGSLRLTEASGAEVEALLDAIAPIDDATYEQDPDWLPLTDLVLGMVDSTGRAWAWPHRILNFHEIVNDTIDGVPLLVSYCPLCRSGVVYDRRLVTAEGEVTLDFGNTSALYENDLVMIDRQTSTYWWQLRGLGIVGELSGVELTVLPSETTRWDRWLAEHPDTMVLTRESGGLLYDRDPFDTYPDVVDSGQFPFPVSEDAAGDDRLPSSELVVVVTVEDTTFAVPTSGDARSVEVEVEGVTVTLDGDGGARVTRDGLPYPSRSAFWFAAVSAFPDIQIISP